jgi:hypothetical protein
MAVVTTYICDISGKQGDRKDFVEVNIKSHCYDSSGYAYEGNKLTISKVVHYDVALKLGLINPRKSDVAPEQTPTFESQLGVLLKDYIADIVYDEVSTQMNNPN